MSMTSAAAFPETPTWLRVLLGIILIIAGVIVLGDVAWASLFSAFVIGIVAIVGGAFEVIHSFWTKGWGGFIWQIILGLLYIVAGVYIVTQPVAGLLALTWIIAIVFLAGGAVRIFVGFQHWSEGGWLLLISGVFGIIAGIIILGGLARIVAVGDRIPARHRPDLRGGRLAGPCRLAGAGLASPVVARGKDLALVRSEGPDPARPVREAGATGIVTALHQIPGGTAWDDAAIAERRRLIEAAGLRWSVVESIPVTNAIKARTAAWRARRRRLEGYAPRPRPGRHRHGLLQLHADRRLDADRPRLAAAIGPGAPLRHRRLRRLRRLHPAARRRRRRLRRRISPRRRRASPAMPEARRAELERIILAGLPGSDFAYDRAEFLDLLKLYDGMGPDELRQSLIEFLNEVVPVAEEPASASPSIRTIRRSRCSACRGSSRPRPTPRRSSTPMTARPTD